MNEEQTSHPVIQNLQTMVTYYENDLNTKRKQLDWVTRNIHLFEGLPTNVNFAGEYLDFDHLNHAQVIKVVKAFPGQWKKEPVLNARINYLIEFDGMKIRCYAGEPPAKCKVVYEEVTIPARTERRAKLICQEREPVAQQLIVEDEIPF